MATNPTLITTPFAESGDKTTPPNTNTPSDGRFSQTLGFPPVTAIPLGSGGKAPKREDFNGAFNMLSNILFYVQKGWQFEWDSNQTYYAGCSVKYNGTLYTCIADVTSTTAPSSDTTHWSKSNIDPGIEYAPINSPAFTGTPTSPTPSNGDNSTKIATTAFVKNAISTGGGGVVASSIDAYGNWYRKYSDGWIEQGGHYTGATGNNATINLVKPMADTNYTALATMNESAPQYDLGITSVTTTTIAVRSSSLTSGRYVYWIAYGQGANS